MQPAIVSVIFWCFFQVQSLLLKNLSRHDIFIAVRTEPNQDTRLELILETWYQNARKETWFFTNVSSSKFQAFTDDHMVVTVCDVITKSVEHRRCCEIEAEFIKYYDLFDIDMGKKWFCHFNDNNYVNIPRLIRVLRQFNYDRFWYFGRRSELSKKTKKDPRKKYWFADLGAGCCLSRALAIQLKQRLSHKKFLQICKDKNLTADAALGYLIEVREKVPLTNFDTWHSCTAENVSTIPTKKLRRQISLCYKGMNNVVKVPGFNRKKDVTRFRSLHCFLFPTKCNKKYHYVTSQVPRTDYDRTIRTTERYNIITGFQSRPEERETLEKIDEDKSSPCMEIPETRTTKDF